MASTSTTTVPQPRKYSGFGVWAFRRDSAASASSSSGSVSAGSHGRRRSSCPNFSQNDPKWKCCGNRHVLQVTKWLCLVEFIFLLSITSIFTFRLLSPLQFDITVIELGSTTFIDLCSLLIKLLLECCTLLLLWYGVHTKHRWHLTPHWLLRATLVFIAMTVYIAVKEPIMHATSMVLLIEMPFAAMPVRCFEYLTALERDEEYWRRIARMKTPKNPRLAALQREGRKNSDRTGNRSDSGACSASSTPLRRHSDDNVLQPTPDNTPKSSADETSATPAFDSSNYRMVQTETGKVLAIPLDEEQGTQEDQVLHAHTLFHRLVQMERLHKMSTVSEVTEKSMVTPQISEAPSGTSVSIRPSDSSHISVFNKAQVDYMFPSSSSSSSSRRGSRDDQFRGANS